MKPIVKQKVSTLQDIINKAQAGGGGGDSYTKAEADAKFETITGAAAAYLSKTDAASTYLSKTAAANMVNKKSAQGIMDRFVMNFSFSVADFNSITNAIVIFNLKNDGTPARMILMCIIYNADSDLLIYNADGSSADSSITAKFSNQTLTLSIALEDDFIDIFEGTATIIY